MNIKFAHRPTPDLAVNVTTETLAVDRNVFNLNYAMYMVTKFGF